MKVLILIISSAREPYNRLEEAIRRTWGSNKSEDIKIFYTYGDGESIQIKNDKIICDCPESLGNIGIKTIISFELLYNKFDFDYIFRTNLSSFIDTENMIKYLDDKPTTNYYAGHCGLNFSDEHLIKFGEGTFASGSGYFLSRDIVKKIIDNKEKWDHSVIDDVAIAGLLKELSILPTNCPRIDITKASNTDILYQADNYHFRCKTSGDRSGDIEIFEKLNSLIKNKKI